MKRDCFSCVFLWMSLLKRSIPLFSRKNCTNSLVSFGSCPFLNKLISEKKRRHHTVWMLLLLSHEMGKQHCQWCKWLLTFISEFMFLKLWTVDWPSTTLVCKELIWWYSLSEQIGVWLLSLHLFLHNMWNTCASWQWWRWDIPSFNFSPLTPSPTGHCISR